MAYGMFSVSKFRLKRLTAAVAFKYQKFFIFVFLDAQLVMQPFLVGISKRMACYFVKMIIGLNMVRHVKTVGK